MSSVESEERIGLTLGASAYLLWGVFPIYFDLLSPTGAGEILAQRMVWSVLTMTVMLLVLRRLGGVAAILRSRRTTGLLCLAAVFISINWGTYIYGVSHGHVVETALGYFITPLVTVLLGVLVLGETMRRAQWIALGISAVACVVLTVEYGHPPYIALILAGSWGTYGLLKKKAGAGAFESFAFESAIVSPFALVYLVWLASAGEVTFGHHGAGNTVLLMLSGLITAIPLILFGAAATRVPMVTLGILQYLAPILQFICGLVYFGEAMPTGRWIGFGLVWIALILFTLDAIRGARSQRPGFATAAS